MAVCIKKVCRICLQEISEDMPHYFLNDSSLMLQLKLLDFMPSIDLSFVPNPMVCLRCTTSIDEIHEFKLMCIRTENTMKYLQTQGIPFEHVLNYINLEMEKETGDEEFLLNELRFDEIENDIMEQLNVDNDTAHKVKIESSEVVFKQEFEEITEDFQLYSLEDVPVEDNNPRINSYSCFHCDYTVKNKSILAKHLRSHRNRPMMRGRMKANLQIPCDRCEFRCNTKWDLKIHKQSHDQSYLLADHMYASRLKNPFVCNICSLNCNSLTEIRKHIYEHKMSKRFKCKTCDFTTNQILPFKAHLRKHKTETFKCKSCSYFTYSEANYERHKKKHELKKPMTCSICNYHCFGVYIYKLHLQEHSLAAVCVLCNYKAPTKNALKAHVRMHI